LYAFKKHIIEGKYLIFKYTRLFHAKKIFFLIIKVVFCLIAPKYAFSLTMLLLVDFFLVYITKRIDKYKRVIPEEVIGGRKDLNTDNMMG
jgi:hypothetical protein